MKFEIMMNILFEMMSKKIVSAKYLAQKYEVSVRTIYRYISALEMAGVPLYTTRGSAGGFSIIDTYRISSSFLTKTEFEQTINVISAILSGVPNKVLDSVLNKLKSTAKHEYSNYNLTAGNLIIDAGPWGDAIGYKGKMSVVSQCIENQTLLEITYHDRNGIITKREIEPHIIIFKQGLWYAYAYCRLRQDFRFFKIGRIESAKVLSVNFSRREIVENDLTLDFWNNNTLAEMIEMEIDPKIVSDIEEWIGIENVKNDNGKFIARAKLPFDNGLISKIMSYGNNLKVIKPKELIYRIKNISKSILDSYK